MGNAICYDDTNGHTDICKTKDYKIVGLKEPSEDMMGGQEGEDIMAVINICRQQCSFPSGAVMDLVAFTPDINDFEGGFDDEFEAPDQTGFDPNQ